MPDQARDRPLGGHKEGAVRQFCDVTLRWSERDSNRRSPVGKRALSFETALVDLSDLLPMRGSNDSLARGTETHRRCV
jgi:hypothetical protein